MKWNQLIKSIRNDGRQAYHNGLACTDCPYDVRDTFYACVVDALLIGWWSEFYKALKVKA